MKIRRITLLVIVLLLASAVAAQDDPSLFSGARALQHVVDQVSVGVHATATVGSIEAGNLILDYLDELGWQTSEDWHMITLGSRDSLSVEAQETLDLWQPINVGDVLAEHLGELTADSRPVEVNNVILPVRNLVASYGTGSTIIIGAHYDSRLFADQDPDPERQRDPVPAANDGGSGVGVLLEMARVLSESYTPNQEIRFVFFDAEDNGHIAPWIDVLPATNGFLIGSALYANSLDLASEDIQYMLLVDMVGDMDQRLPVEGYSNQAAPEIVSAIWQTAADLGYGDQFITTPRGAITDDHVPFIQRGIPAVDIIDLDYPYWHTTEDTPDKVSPESLERVGRTIIAYLEQTGAITPKN